MPNTTINYNLKKPIGNEFYNIEDQNSNMDIIDGKLKEIDNKTSNITVPVTSVNTKTGNVVLTASDIKAGDGTTLEIFKSSTSVALENIENKQSGSILYLYNNIGGAL